MNVSLCKKSTDILKRHSDGSREVKRGGRYLVQIDEDSYVNIRLRTHVSREISALIIGAKKYILKHERDCFSKDVQMCKQERLIYT